MYLHGERKTESGNQGNNGGLVGEVSAVGCICYLDVQPNRDGERGDALGEAAY